MVNTEQEIKVIINNIQNALDIEYDSSMNLNPFNYSSSNGGYKISNKHFENGPSLHSSQYYFAKRYFQSKDNCLDLVKLLERKLSLLGYNKNTTLIGFRGYSGMLLRLICDLLPSMNYAIIEQDKNNFVWQFIPDFDKFNETLLIILPISSTCSTYIRLRKYLTEQLGILSRKHIIENKKNKKWKISNNFINIFIVLDKDLKNINYPIIVDTDKLNFYLKRENKIPQKLELKLSKLYSSFNWESIYPEYINFNINKNFNNNNHYIAHPLVKLYSDLYLPEDCPFCFPENKKLLDERYLFPTNNNFETPSLIFGFPNYGSISQLNIINKSPLENFNELFSANAVLGPTHLYGHITVNKSSYLSYIRGNAFYQNNRKEILNYFNSQIEIILSKIKKENKNIDEIVFITTEGKHNSKFLDEISSYGILGSIKVNVLRFDPTNEFIENFMSLYKTLIKKNNNLVIYFEEVLSAARTFKLISNHLKHYDNFVITEKRHGFDYVFTIIDRTTQFTREEIIGKLYSYKNTYPQNNFIIFFNLNVPIVAASHLGNPLKDRIDHLIRMILESHLDVLKRRIGIELPNRVAKELPEDNIINDKIISLKYFPFENESGIVTIEILNIYKDFLINGKFDLLKLYMTHKINAELSNMNVSSDYNDSPENLIFELINRIQYSIEIKNELFFCNRNNIENSFRNDHLIGVESQILKDTIIKTLSRYPFIYYKNIYESIFKFCLKEFNKIVNEIEKNKGFKSFECLRKLKFYIRRLIDLNSSYLISEKFIYLLKMIYEISINPQNSINEDILNPIYDSYCEILTRENIEKNNNQIDELNYVNKNNFTYKYNQIFSFPSFLLYSYKELIFKNHYRSLKFEKLINSKQLLPRYLTSNFDNTEELNRLITDPYYHLTGMLKSENIYLLNMLKELHKTNYLKFTKSYFELINNKLINENEKHDQINSLKSYWPTFLNPISVNNYYFLHWKSDPIIINARKFVNNSMEINNPKYLECIKLAISNMLVSSTLLLNHESSFNHYDKLDFNEPFIDEINRVVKSVVRIIQPGIEEAIIEPGTSESNLQYAICIEYRKKTEDNLNTDNIFSISSDKSVQRIELVPSGLICNMMRGIYESIELGTNVRMAEQSLLVAVNISEIYTSFKDEYYIREQISDTPVKFDSLYKSDCFNNSTKKGLRILNNAQMSIFFRLSKVNLSKLNQGECELEGQAVLIISCSLEANIKNYLNFMNNEKIRLLLLIKEELLRYLGKKFDSDAFIELLKSKENLEFVNSMKHNVNNYFRAMKNVLESKRITDAEVTLLVFLKQKIHAHFKLISEGTNDILIDSLNENSFYTEKQFEQLFNLIMRVPYLARKRIPYDSYKLRLEINNFKCNEYIYELVFPELMINMRKHSLRSKESPKRFKIVYSENTIIFENGYEPDTNPEPNTLKINGGKDMCIKICNQLKIKWDEETDKINKKYRVKLQFK
ncbi:MAG: hypothetical protein NTU44_16385 [Bacteroidetes bacterium]|nr:hypothetical protein [Bacteroidota bacterium]